MDSDTIYGSNGSDTYKPSDEVKTSEPSIDTTGFGGETGTASATTPVTPVSATTASAPVDEKPTYKDKAKVYFASASTWTEKSLGSSRDFLKTYAFEVFLVAAIAAAAAFIILFPRTALLIAGVIAAFSGWIAYYGLRSRTLLSEEYVLEGAAPVKTPTQE